MTHLYYDLDGNPIDRDALYELLEAKQRVRGEGGGWTLPENDPTRIKQANRCRDPWSTPLPNRKEQP